MAPCRDGGPAWVTVDAVPFITSSPPWLLFQGTPGGVLAARECGMHKIWEQPASPRAIL